MQQAAIPGFKLSRSRRSTKILTSLGLIGVLLGLLSASLLTVSRTGLTPQAVQSYYLGTPSGELDGLLAATTKRPFDELAEVTHLHLSGGSLLLFLLCHLLSVCEISERTRIFWYGVSFSSFIATFSLPWLIVYVSPAFAWLFGVSIITLLASLISVAFIPLREMWWKGRT